MIRLVDQSQKLKERKCENSEDYGLASNNCFFAVFKGDILVTELFLI